MDQPVLFLGIGGEVDLRPVRSSIWRPAQPLLDGPEVGGPIWQPLYHQRLLRHLGEPEVATRGALMSADTVTSSSVGVGERGGVRRTDSAKVGWLAPPALCALTLWLRRGEAVPLRLLLGCGLVRAPTSPLLSGLESKLVAETE